jgi:hypothetical protein
VHSKVQIIASGAEGGKFLSQHSQLGRSSSIVWLLMSRQLHHLGAMACTSLALVAQAASKKPRSVPVET